MTHLTPLARGSRYPKEFTKCLLTRGGVPKDPDHRRHAQAEEGRMTKDLIHFIHIPFCSMVLIKFLVQFTVDHLP